MKVMQDNSQWEVNIDSKQTNNVLMTSIDHYYY
jgi:hypothetical protein